MAAYENLSVNMQYNPNNDHYKTLGLNWRATREEVKVGYRSAVRRCHPDKNNGSSVASELTKKINVAGTILRDSAQRREYDESRGRYLAAVKLARPLRVKKVGAIAKRKATAVEFASPLINQFARKGEFFSALALFVGMSFLDGNNQRA